MKIQKIPWMLVLFFSFKGNLVISLCNQNVKKTKMPLNHNFIFFVLRVFKSFYCIFKILKDLYVPNEYDN